MSGVTVKRRKNTAIKLPRTVLAVLTALFAECVEKEGCGWIHAYAIAEKMGVSYRAARLALIRLEELGAAKRQVRVVGGRARVEYRLTTEGKELAIEQLREFLRSDANAKSGSGAPRKTKRANAA